MSQGGRRTSRECANEQVTTAPVGERSASLGASGTVQNTPTNGPIEAAVFIVLRAVRGAVCQPPCLTHPIPRFFL